MNVIRGISRILVVAAAVLLSPVQAYPTKPVRFIVPFASASA